MSSIRPYLNYNEKIIALAQYLGFDLDIDEDDDEAVLELQDELDKIEEISVDNTEFRYNDFFGSCYLVLTEEEAENVTAEEVGRENGYLIYEQ